MQDGVTKGTGDSRYLKSVSNFLTQYPSYEDFAKALVAGTLPVDFNGINEAGWSQIGTALNKASLLTDATAALYSLTTDAVPDDVLAAIKTLINSVNTTANSKAKIETGTYVGTGGTSSGMKKTLSFSFAPTLVFIAGKDGYGGQNLPMTVVKVGTSACTENSNGSYARAIDATFSGNSISWTVYNGLEYMNCNATGTTYYYTAIG